MTARHHAIEDLGPDVPFEKAVRLMVWTRFEAMWKHREGTIAGDVEALHDMRVGSRRLRAAVDMAAPICAGKEYTTFRRQTRDLTTALGDVRDRDVLLQTFEALGTATGPEGASAAAALTRLVSAERVVYRERLLAFLDDLESAGYARSAARLWRTGPGHADG
jgi:CHAD domain-containing protein